METDREITLTAVTQREPSFSARCLRPLLRMRKIRLRPRRKIRLCRDRASRSQAVHPCAGEQPDAVSRHDQHDTAKSLHGGVQCQHKAVTSVSRPYGLEVPSADPG